MMGGQEEEVDDLAWEVRRDDWVASEEMEERAV